MDNKFDANQRQLNKRNGGFSLIEVIVSMVILAIVSIPLLSYFSDSLKSSARMAQRQQATVLAQQVTEMIKAQDQLIMPVSDGLYQVPILTDAVQPDENDLNIGGLGLEMKTGFAADGTGTAEFVTPAGLDATGTNPFGYDIRVTLSTNVSANQVKRPMVYGIDDGADVLALETVQQTEALAYFMAANNDYYMANEATAVLLTKEEVAELLNRNIMISIDWDPTENNYLVRVWYEYTVSTPAGVNWISPSLALSLVTNPWTGTFLTETRMTSVSSIYLLYDKQGTAAQLTDDKLKRRDDVIIKMGLDTANAMTTSKLEVPDFYLVCQNPQESKEYELYVDWSKCQKEIDDSKLHSNIKKTDANSTGKFIRISSTGAKKDLNENGIIDSDTPTRIISIETEVYPMGTFSGGTINSDDALAVVKTTKGG